jgi:hypothetical protein
MVLLRFPGVQGKRILAVDDPIGAPKALGHGRCARCPREAERHARAHAVRLARRRRRSGAIRYAPRSGTRDADPRCTIEVTRANETTPFDCEGAVDLPARASDRHAVLPTWRPRRYRIHLGFTAS